MAKISVHEVAGMRRIRLGIADRMGRAQGGALSKMRPRGGMTRRRPDLVRFALGSGARVRPSGPGTGSPRAQPASGGHRICAFSGTGTALAGWTERPCRRMPGEPGRTGGMAE